MSDPTNKQKKQCLICKMMIITHSVSWRTMCVVGLSAGGGKFLATSNTATQWR